MGRSSGAPNWEEILGGEFAKRSKDANFDGFEAAQKAMMGEFETPSRCTLPRLCEHCLNPACVASCPSGSIYKRGRDGIVLDRPGQCRGWRMCVSGLPVQEDLLQLEERQGREVHLLLSAHRGRASPRSVPRPASAASATWACCCTTPTVSPGRQRRARDRPLPGTARHLPRSE